MSTSSRGRTIWGTQTPGQDIISSHTAASPWATDLRPAPAPAYEAHTWALHDLRQLAAVRREARALLLATCTDPEDDDAVERAVLVLDELASNALRHGTTPASVRLTDHGDSWLLVATDSAPHQLPTPAYGRPAGHGGYGLHVITDLATSRGTHVDHTVKHVWARCPKT